MSKYEWESGTIKIPAKEWSSFRKQIISAWNEEQDRLLAEAKAAYKSLKENPSFQPSWKLRHLIFVDGKPQLPTAKVVNKLPVSKGAILRIDGASIALNDEQKTVQWDVEENNHACEDARSQPLARLMFKLLNDMEWTRGSGGSIIGNDEYNRDNRSHGGGGNYTTASYGPREKKKEPEINSPYRGTWSGYAYGGRRF